MAVEVVIVVAVVDKEEVVKGVVTVGMVEEAAVVGNVSEVL